MLLNRHICTITNLLEEYLLCLRKQALSQTSDKHIEQPFNKETMVHLELLQPFGMYGHNTGQQKVIVVKTEKTLP